MARGLAIVHFGGDPTATGQFYPHGGEHDRALTTSATTALGSWRCPGTNWALRAVTWKSEAAAADTDLKVHHAGSAVLTVELDGAAGVVDGLSLDTDASVAVGLEYDAGTDPGDGTYSLEMEPSA